MKKKLLYFDFEPTKRNIKNFGGSRKTILKIN